MIQWTKIIWVNNHGWLINSFSKPNKSKKSRKVDRLLFLRSLITHYTLHNTQYIPNTTQHTLCTTHYILHSFWVAWLLPNRWKRTEDRGQRKKYRGPRSEDRGQRTEDFKLIWSLSFNWHPMVDQSLGVFLKRLWGTDCVSKVTDCQFFLWSLNMKLTIHHVSMIAQCNGITETHPMLTVFSQSFLKGQSVNPTIQCNSFSLETVLLSLESSHGKAHLLIHGMENQLNTKSVENQYHQSGSWQTHDISH